MRFALMFVVAASTTALVAGCKTQPSTQAAPSTSAPALTAPAAASTRPGAPSMPSLQGKILETTEVANYTYMHLETADGKVWAAVPKTTVAVGGQVTIERPMPMKNFHSPTLNRDFETIYFGVIPGSPSSSMAMPPNPAPAASVPSVIKVPKAKGPNAHTVEEIATDAAKLAGKPVVVQAMVVKVNTAIMDRNWVHIQDGTGSPESKTHDVLVTTSDVPKPGEVVLVKGKVAVDKNFGSGYAYKFMIEEASVVAAKP